MNGKLNLDIKQPLTLATLVGSVISLIAALLPQCVAKVEIFGEVDKTTGHLMADYAHQGIFILILAIAAVGILLFVHKEKVLSGVLGALCAVDIWGMYNVIKDVSDAKKEIKSSGLEDYASANYQVGFFLLVIGTIVVAIAVIIASIREKKGVAAN